jgi:hypothetical protein
MAQESGITKNQIISQLSRSAHGKLSEYGDLVKQAAGQEPEFLAHLIAWDRQKGQIRDAKIALPVLSLTVPGLHPELAENSLAHIALLGPRELLRAYRFALETRPQGYMLRLKKLVAAYLKEKELQPRAGWNEFALQHRATLKELYALTHTKPSKDADEVALKGLHPEGTIFEVVARLKDMTATEAAGEIMARRIPFLVAFGALGARAKDTDVLVALISAMSPTELVSNTKMLEKLGMKTNPAVRGAYAEALQKAEKSKKNVLKTTRAAEAVEDEGLKEKLRGLQDKQLQGMGVDGNWLVLGDASGSMEDAIEVAKQVAGVLAKMVKGKVWLVFFNTHPQTIDVTGASLDVIQKATRHIRADGGTSIGCGLLRMLDGKVDLDGIAVISDGGENTAPYFHHVYPKYAQFAGKEPPVYLYHVGKKGRSEAFTQYMRGAGIDLQVFDVAGNADYYSLPNLVQTMRVQRYSLLDEVMAAKLLTLSDIFTRTQKKKEKETLHA